MWHMSKRIKRFSANQTFFIDATSVLIVSTDTDVRAITRYRKQRKGTLCTAKWRFEDNAAKDKTYPHRSDARRSASTEMRNNKETSQRSETRSMSTMCLPDFVAGLEYVLALPQLSDYSWHCARLRETWLFFA